MPDSGTAAEAQLRSAIARVGARMRYAVALILVERALWCLGLGAALAIVCARLGRISAAAAWLSVAAGASVAALAVLWRARPVPAPRAAALADHALGLADRLTTANAFLHEPAPTELMRLAIADGARVSASVDARAVVRVSLPSSVYGLPILALLLLLVGRLQLPHAEVLSVAPPSKPRFVVEEDALQAERETLRKLADEAKGKDPHLAALAQELDAVLKDIDQQKLSRNEAFAKLAALEAKVEKDRADAPPKPKAELAALEKALASSKATRAMAEALKKDDLAAAQSELQKLAAQAEARAKEQNSPEQKQAQEELARALDKASKALDEARKKSDQERDRKIEELKDEERRLQKEKQEHPDDEDTERKLQKNKRERERLERERENQKEQRRQLERLSRELQEAAEQLRQKMSPEAMKRAAEELGKMEDEIRKLGSSGRAQMQIAELKEVLRRAGRVESGDGSDGQGKNAHSQRADGQGKHGPGEPSRQPGGKGDERGERLREFDERAGGEPNALILGGDKPGDTTVMLPLPMGQGEQPGQSGNDPGKDPGGKGDPDKPGDGIGSEHDPNLFGARTQNKTQQKLIKATGQAGKGPSRSQTILGAAERGFSSREYQRVYKDYASVVEEVMSQEGVPPGYRYYVKRYFQLIRPRE